MTTNFEDQVTALDKEKETALNEVDEKYGALISQSDKFYQDQIDATQNFADEQKRLQQEQTDFTVKQIEQQKEQLGKDYTKEQSAAYVDFKKQSNPHGVNAERIAAGGMWGSGYSESAQTAMYTAYQNRVATAKASFDQAVVDYNNAMKQAELQNSSVLAEIAFNAFQQKMELTMQAFVSRNELLDAQASARARVESNYLDVLEGINDSEETLNNLKEKYPDGIVTNQDQWNELVEEYGEDVLSSAGVSLSAGDNMVQFWKKATGKAAKYRRMMPMYGYCRTYKNASSFLKKIGWDVSILTRDEWTNRRMSYAKNGQGSAAVTNYESYSDYLQAYCLYAIEQISGQAG